MTIEPYAENTFSLFPAPWLSLSAAEFSISVALIFICCIVISYLATREPRQELGVTLFAVGVSGLLVNGLLKSTIAAAILILPVIILALAAGKLLWQAFFYH